MSVYTLKMYKKWVHLWEVVGGTNRGQEEKKSVLGALCAIEGLIKYRLNEHGLKF